MKTSKLENPRDEISISMGKVIKDIRKEKGITLKELGLSIDMSASYLSEIESGKASPNLEVYRKIVDALGSKLYRVIFKATGDLNAPKPKNIDMQSFDKIFERLEDLVDNLSDDGDDDDDNNIAKLKEPSLRPSLSNR